MRWRSGSERRGSSRRILHTLKSIALRTRESVQFGGIVICLLTVILAGCTVAGVNADRQAHARAVACCADESLLPSPQPLGRVQVVQFAPDSPHFDFGMELAPFARYQFEPGSVRSLEVRAYPRSSGTLFGGDGTFHYANVQLRFYDANGQQLQFPEPADARIETVGFAGHYALLNDVEVPPQAAMLLVSTDARAFGARGEATAVDDGRMVMASGLFIWIPQSQREMPFTLSAYGKVELISR